MKRILAFLVCISVLLSGMVFAQDVVIGKVSAVAADETVAVEFSVTDNFDGAKDFEPYVAIYNSQKQLLDIKIAVEKSGQSGTFSAECSAPKDKTGIHGKVFVWSDELSPYAEAEPFEIDMHVITGKDDAPYTPNY